jgi:hypothetical protein
VTYTRVVDWMIGFIDNLSIQLVTTVIDSAIDILTLYRQLLHTLSSSVLTSHILTTDSNTVVIPVSHMKCLLRSIIPFWPLFCQLPTPETLVISNPISSCVGSSSYSLGADAKGTPPLTPRLLWHDVTVHAYAVGAT